MNKQGPNGIEWTHYTWNPVAGCFHGCQWMMPNGKLANCYAEDVAEGIAASAYPQGFENHYWHQARLVEPFRIKKPSRIFVGSMADVFGSWVTDEQIEKILYVVRECHWHSFQFLTKNPARLKHFEFPKNAWIGASVPPSNFKGHELSLKTQENILRRTLGILNGMNKNGSIRWLSIEPLQWRIDQILDEYPDALDWVVIGAASNGKEKYQPSPFHLMPLLEILRVQNTPVFFKGNLKDNVDIKVWREEFPI